MFHSSHQTLDMGMATDESSEKDAPESDTNIHPGDTTSDLRPTVESGKPKPFYGKGKAKQGAPGMSPFINTSVY
jgi:hypothetical protein